MRFEFEWQEAPGVRDKVLEATWSRLRLSVDGLCASEAIDFRSSSRRSGIYGSLFPLAEWIVEQWWQLLHEPSPCSPVPGGRVAPRYLRSWVQRHNLLAARDGGALPDLTISRDGDDILLQWEADPTAVARSRVRFIGQGSVRVHAADFEQAVRGFVDAILARLEDERVSGNEDVERLLDAWNEICSADHAERTLCESLAVMGVDPYDPDEATDVLIEAVERSIGNLPAKLRADLLEASDAESFIANLNWVETERASLGSAITDPGLPSVDLVTAPSAHETGYLAARRVRSELLGIGNDDPIPDIASVLVDRLGWTKGCTRRVASGTELQGMVGLDAASSTPLLLIADARGQRAERFRLARASFFPVTRSLGGSARLLTSSATSPQRAARAFAAELLAPAAALERRVSGRIHDEDVEQLADEFLVSPLVISHQIKNHGLGYMGT